MFFFNLVLSDVSILLGAKVRRWGNTRLHCMIISYSPNYVLPRE
jgi:hypothetical protein